MVFHITPFPSTAQAICSSRLSVTSFNNIAVSVLFMHSMCLRHAFNYSLVPIRVLQGVIAYSDCREPWNTETLFSRLLTSDNGVGSYLLNAHSLLNPGSSCCLVDCLSGKWPEQPKQIRRSYEWESETRSVVHQQA